MQIPDFLQIGIISGKKIEFSLLGKYTCQNNTVFDGEQSICIRNNQILFHNNLHKELILKPIDYNKNSFELKNVTIGIRFHWEQKENQRFKGTLKFIVENNIATAINIINVEDYLISVISSEMSATSLPELLKAHAVISRSWALHPFCPATGIPTRHFTANNDKTIVVEKIYERDFHKNFDVCADDHCQRYQGISKATTNNVMAAVAATKGEVLWYNDGICDARFSKSCGGASETFESCWSDLHHNYLEKIHDTKKNIPQFDLSNEDNIRDWILNPQESFCNTHDKDILSQVLNTYDQSTDNFYRWKTEYSQQELSEIVKTSSGIDFGKITDLIPLKRGSSGRIIYLKIIGTKQTRIVGKELEIRKWLSRTHLYSSAFVVERNAKDGFVLHGAGWGHGVGLCQIGAAIMSNQGFSYQEILAHYYKNAKIKKIY